MINNNFVSSVFVLRHIIKNPIEYESELKNILKIPLNNKLSYGNIQEYNWSFEDIFLDSTTWKEIELNPNEIIVNRIYNSLFNQKNQKGKTLKEAIKDYNENKFSNEDMKIINTIRKKLKINPKIIVLTKDQKEYAIYDGWHTAVAFAIENKKIPAYVGIRNSFLCYK